MDSREYWAKREDAARRAYMAEEARHLKQLQEIYLSMYQSIEKEIGAFYAKYASMEGISLAEAKKRAGQLDIAAYAKKAKRYVAEKNFSEEANAQMRLYNLTMKVNRLELLRANIALELVAGFDEMKGQFEGALDQRAKAEYKRQAGILGGSVYLSEKMASELVNASFHHASYSERIWMHQEILRAELDKQLRIGLIQGRNPKVLARSIRERFRVSQRDAERLMITELARVQSGAQKSSFERNGYEAYEFIAEPTACPVCRALDGKRFAVSAMMPGENCAPMHPRCRCSAAADAKLPWEELEGHRLLEMDLQFFGNKIDDRKLSKYALDPNGDPDKAIAFKKALGYTQNNFKELKRNVLEHLQEDKFIEAGDGGYGIKYIQNLVLRGANGKTAKVKTVWIADGEDKRLVTLYVDK